MVSSPRWGLLRAWRSSRDRNKWLRPAGVSPKHPRTLSLIGLDNKQPPSQGSVFTEDLGPGNAAVAAAVQCESRISTSKSPVAARRAPSPAAGAPAFP